MIRATFQLIAGLGPTRERNLWAAGFRDWNDLQHAHPLPGVPERLASDLRAAARDADLELQRRELVALAPRIPNSEKWRLLQAFSENAICLDIETDEEEGVTTIGLLRADGPHLLFAGRNLHHFPSLCPPDALLITFNGLSFDVPVLRQAFPEWVAPVAHVDLRHIWARLGHHGGLKALENKVGVGRPPHLRELDGSAASAMWRHARHGDARALRLLGEYNLYDTINLRTLAAMAWNRLTAQNGFDEAALPVSYRGDVLYDVSKLLLAL